MLSEDRVTGESWAPSKTCKMHRNQVKNNSKINPAIEQALTPSKTGAVDLQATAAPIPAVEILSLLCVSLGFPTYPRLPLTSLGISGWLQTQSSPPVSAPQVLGFQAWGTMHSLVVFLI